MKKIIASFKKEVLLLIRDIPGLVILFLMPMLLVLVVTIVQEKAFRTLEDQKITILYVDNDNSEMGEMIATGLKKSGFFTITQPFKKKADKEIRAKKAVSRGDYKVGIIVPEYTTKTTYEKAELFLNAMLKGKDPDLILFQDTTDIILYLDPAIRGSYRNSVSSSLKGLIQGLEVKLLVNKMSELLPKEINKQIAEKTKKYEKFIKDKISIEIPKMKFPWHAGYLLKTKEIFAIPEKSELKPSVAQNNVPAFTLFAMFFIVVPLSGFFINEKTFGVLDRIKTIPVSYFSIITGKVIVYLIVCMIQFVLMLLVGIYILPLFKATALEMGSNYLAILCAAITSSLGAIGFGIFIGSFLNSREQAPTFGAVTVVIMGILGGVMVPIHLMPGILKTISSLSPIRWGIDAFTDIFIYDSGIKSVLPNCSRLILLFLITIGISIFGFMRRK